MTPSGMAVLFVCLVWSFCCAQSIGQATNCSDEGLIRAATPFVPLHGLAAVDPREGLSGSLLDMDVSWLHVLGISRNWDS